MNKIYTILTREYLNIVKKKSFIISAILTPVLMIGAMLIPTFFAEMTVIKERRIAVIDGTSYVLENLIQSRQTFTALVNLLDQQKKAEESGKPSAEKPLNLQNAKMEIPSGQVGKFLREMGEQMLRSFAAIKFQKIEVTPATWEAVRKEQLNNIRKEVFDVLLIIPPDIETGRVAEYYARSAANFDETRLLERFITESVVSRRLSQEGFDPIKIKSLSTPVSLKTSNVTKTGVKSSDSLTSYLGGIIFVMLMFMAVFSTGQQLMRGVLEEKNNRIIEVLLSSLKSNQLMTGKIIGLGAAGLTLVVIWITAGLIGMKLSGGLGVSFDMSLMWYFALYFILGYLLYSTFMAILGAVMNSEQEAQQFISIISISLIFPIFFAMMILKDPNSTLSTILTMIPIFTPTMIIFRSAITPVPIIEVIVSTLILIGTIWLMILLTSKVFRVGILMYGKKPTLKEIVKWMKYK
jgi:ABC-2 type transport system permease protein